MVKRNIAATYKTIEKRIKAGRGQGSGATYKPWITVQDFSSCGQSNRDLGWKTNRQHDLHSKGERNYFLILEWSPIVTDIQEHFPLLPVEKTLSIAKHCGIRHPVDRQTKEPRVLTTDFLITLARPIGATKVARTFKPADKLIDKRVIELFEIERRFWRDENKDWGIVTDKEINLVVAGNVDWVHKFRTPSSLQPLSEKLIQLISLTLSEMVSRSDQPLNEVALECDDRLGLELGTSLSVARHLIASKQWLVDITHPIHPCMKLNLLGVSLATTELRKVGAR
jgi:TnsA endonuclease N terminal/TnsA endonuclease C terminal